MPKAILARDALLALACVVMALGCASVALELGDPVLCALAAGAVAAAMWAVVCLAVEAAAFARLSQRAAGGRPDSRRI